ncbi:YIP1 family protein [Thermocoleostomius sinensis]|uniref:YIP1 family protein n=1 Tax=Thermocoleostomius sinensis A174 TaxID=2016057 RepID=A0A9E9C843_9CYAN|nr:YIP1 family protein [Thermocoleostomius sinensis]WAL59928.1 YIP1 family protein [Thermocoleostomius sinensis A174]
MPESMTTGLVQFWSLVQEANALNPDAFRAIEVHPAGILLAITVILLVGLSQSIGQGIVLFLNQVKPIRFVLSLGIAAILFVFSVAFWVLSVWVVSHLLYGVDVSFLKVFRVLGLSYAPLLWSFLVAIPYLGVPINVVLSVWSLLAFVRGFSVVTELDRWQVLGSAICGWVVFQIMQRTIGRPAITLGHWVSSSVAGVPLVTNLRQLEQTVQSSFTKAVDNSNRNQGGD